MTPDVSDEVYEDFADALRVESSGVGDDRLRAAVSVAVASAMESLEPLEGPLMVWCEGHGFSPAGHCYLHAQEPCYDPNCGPCPGPLRTILLGPKTTKDTPSPANPEDRICGERLFVGVWRPWPTPCSCHEDMQDATDVAPNPMTELSAQVAYLSDTLENLMGRLVLALDGM
jgi:hypothetical protein